MGAAQTAASTVAKIYSERLLEFLFVFVTLV
jgi:hypothetical protein